MPKLRKSEVKTYYESSDSELSENDGDYEAAEFQDDDDEEEVDEENVHVNDEIGIDDLDDSDTDDQMVIDDNEELTDDNETNRTILPNRSHYYRR